MDNIFSQPKLIYKIRFNTIYKFLSQFEAFFERDDVIGVTTFEIDSLSEKPLENEVWCFEVYLNQDPKETFLIESLTKFIQENELKLIGDINIGIVEDKDWVLEYQKQLVPIIIGQFFISSYDRKNQCPEGHLPIIIEASRAFGTGHHATTFGCLRAIEELASAPFKTICDIGTGSGILSFAAAKIWPNAKIIACDVEEVAIEVAKINQSFNNSPNIDFFQNSLYDLMIKEIEKFDLIVSNILSQPLINLSTSIKSLLKNNGVLIISGFLDYQMNDVLSAYEKISFKVEKIIEEKSWITLVMKLEID